MNGEIKKHIDAARQVLVGVVPNPSSQIDQITYALIYKFMDDMDQAAIKSGDKPSFFIDDLEEYSWARLMDSKLGNQEKMNLYVLAFQKFAEAKQLPELFRNILKSAFLPYRSPETLGLFLKEINYFDYSHPEELGNAYEYLLSIMSSQGDAGQFRTPRHIIDFIVNVVNPTKDDKILDPACGTGGFLISSYKHILEQHDGKDDPEGKEKPLIPDERRKLMSNLEGYDIDPGMVRIAQVNMYLHQFKDPKIFQYDTLSSEERWNDKFDVILANPPFMSPKGGITPHKKFSIQSNRSEVLFVDYIMNHLRPKGRAGIIVPEGIIFQSGNAYKELRKNLVNDGLCAVVSLPSGVFNPYSGVKTSILFFDNEIAKKTNEILFIKINNDGFSLGAQRKPIEKNDLPEALDILKKWKTGKKEESELVVYVEKSRIAKNDDYNLSADKYKLVVDNFNRKYELVELKDIAKIDWGNTNLTKSSYVENGDYLAVSATGGDGRISHYEHEKGVIVLSAIGANCGRVFFPKERFTAIKNTITFTPNNKVLSGYLYAIMRNNSLPKRGGAQPFMSKGDVEKYKIPLPPIEVQEEIIKELDGYQNIIIGAKQIVDNWRPRIDIDPEWEKARLGDMCIIGDGNYSSKYPKASDFIEKGIPFLTATNLKNGTIIVDGIRFISEEQHKILTKGHVIENDLVIVVRGSSTGNNSIVPIGYAGSNINSQLVFLRANKVNIDSKYLFFIFNSDNVQRVVFKAISGAAQPQLPNNKLLDIYIPLPSLEIQEQIVKRIERERVLVESSKKLISIYEKKIDNRISEIWNK